LNHGLELSEDGKTLYASSISAVYAWDYDASQGRNTSGPREIIGDFGSTEGHASRTLLLSRKEPGMLLVSRGSLDNIDYTTLNKSTGVSTIKAFNLTNLTDSSRYSFPDDGVVLGWGLRNSVGVAEEPVTGAIYSVENSVDDFNRSDESIHQNNPGEEMNFHGYLNGTQTDEQGGNYGLERRGDSRQRGCPGGNPGLDWRAELDAQRHCLQGRQGAPSPDLPGPPSAARPQVQSKRNCGVGHVPRLMVRLPLPTTHIHASILTRPRNRDDPIGYKLSYIAFDGAGSPVANASSNASAIDVVSNADLSKCPDKCFRPVGLAWDSEGRLFMSSDSTGEIWVVTREDGGSVEDASPSGGAPSATDGAPSPTESAPAETNSPGAASGNRVSVGLFAVVWAAALAAGV
jgi:hypothetical protein